GDHIKVTPSKFPFPTVCHDSQSKDWFSSISRCLRWNERERQKSFVVVEEDKSEDEYNEDDDTSTKVSESSEQESSEYNEVKLQNTQEDHKLDLIRNNINGNKSNKQLHRNDHAFACLGKDVDTIESFLIDLKCITINTVDDIDFIKVEVDSVRNRFVETTREF
ncbi:6090_t:CDS:2, partial [Diversispora eburnea]